MLILAVSPFVSDYYQMANDDGLPRFKDPDGDLERFGFENAYGPSRLPGLTWETGNMFNSTTFMPNCDMEDAVFQDTVWGLGLDGKLAIKREAPVLTELFYSNAIRRLQAIEQLTLPPEYTTIPNTAAFSRFEHVWGSVLFVKKVAEQAGMDSDEILESQLRTLLSDVGQTTGSHLGDWAFQGVGGSEDLHDMELDDYLAVTGIADILRSHDIAPEKVVFPDVVDWVEAPSPDLCVDRVDYGLREMNRWNDMVSWQGFSAADFVLTPDKMLAMTDQRRARVFAEGYLLLSQEHWSEPTHRFLLELMMLKTKLFYAQGGSPDTWVFNSPDQAPGLVPLYDMHPRDLMYVTDPTQLQSLARHNLGGGIIDSIMRTIAQYRRQYVWPGRRDRIAGYMQQFTSENSYRKILDSGQFVHLEDESFGNFMSEYPAYLPSGFTVLEAGKAAVETCEEDIDFLQEVPFKIRQIDPLVRAGTGFEQLSTLDPTYTQRLREHREQLSQPWIARLSVPDANTRKMLNAIINNVEEEWQIRLQTSRRMTKEELKRLVDASSSEIHGRYPFLTFLSY